jgi:hypothetical protein
VDAAECPFCEARPRDRVRHIASYHRDRLRAMAAMRQVLAEGGSEEEARAAYNRVVVGARPGHYNRDGYRRTA